MIGQRWVTVEAAILLCSNTWIFLRLNRLLEFLYHTADLEFPLGSVWRARAESVIRTGARFVVQPVEPLPLRAAQSAVPRSQATWCLVS